MSRPIPQNMTASLPLSPQSTASPDDNALSHSSPAPSASSPSSSAAPTPAADSSLGHRCAWVDCTLAFPDPEALYNHLCNDHIGRKSTGNLCLTCKWKDCGTSCAKRDHITSHLRVHTPLKPHSCEICKKSFKRPQDLKKHEKIHTEEHHAQHKHSKAITVVDPVYVSRVRGDVNRTQDKKPPSAASSALRAPPKSHGSPVSDAPHFGVLPTPSPELTHASIHSHAHHQSSDVYLQHQLPSWEVLRTEAPPASAPTGSKRSHDFNVDEFFTDVKKRRVTPAYDPRMAERLNHLAYNHHPNAGHAQSNFNPRSVSLDIRTPEELAAVNEFLVTLGRDVAGGRGNGNFSPETYFDPVSLSQLGIAGMPGLSTSNSNYNDTTYSSQTFSTSYATRSHPSVQPNQYGAVYGGVHDSSVTYSPPGDYGQNARRIAAKYPSPPASYPGHHQPTPPLESSSPHSTVSTPLNSTPPQFPISIPDSSAFDFMRAPRGAPPVAQLAPADFPSKHLRQIAALKSVPPPAGHRPSSSASTSSTPSDPSSAALAASRPEPVEPKLPTAVHRLPAKLTPVSASASSSSNRDSLYPLLTSGDIQYRLAPLNKMYRSPSPPSRESTPSSTHSSPTVQTTVLPSLRSIAPPFTTPARSDSEDLSREISRIELENRTREISPDQRRTHAELIRNLLVTINVQFKDRFGDLSKEARDVDMASP